MQLIDRKIYSFQIHNAYYIQVNITATLTTERALTNIYSYYVELNFLSKIEVVFPK